MKKQETNRPIAEAIAEKGGTVNYVTESVTTQFLHGCTEVHRVNYLKDGVEKNAYQKVSHSLDGTRYGCFVVSEAPLSGDAVKRILGA